MVSSFPNIVLRDKNRNQEFDGALPTKGPAWKGRVPKPGAPIVRMVCLHVEQGPAPDDVHREHVSETGCIFAVRICNKCKLVVASAISGGLLDG
jgi:hypothetical protein